MLRKFGLWNGEVLGKSGGLRTRIRGGIWMVAMMNDGWN